MAGKRSGAAGVPVAAAYPPREAVDPFSLTESRPGALAYASRFAGASLLPLTLGLGALVFVVFEQLFGRTVGGVFGLTFTTGSVLLLYGLGIALRRPSRRKKMPDQTATPLKIKIEQMLTEARVIIPGGQALMGFQFICTFTRSFRELPLSIQYLHAAALCANDAPLK